MLQTGSHPQSANLSGELGRDELIRAFRVMYLARRLDDREILLKRQNRIFFQISGAGHEAVQAAAGFVMRAGYDWIYPYYRDRALCLMMGVTADEMMLQATGAAADPASGGRQMPSHWGHARWNIVSSSSPTGTQFLQAMGCAQAGLRLDPSGDEVTLVTTGDGATSEGEFWESLNIACLERLPVLYLVEDNGYAISVPIEKQTAGGSISKLAASFPGLFIHEVDGTDVVASYEALRRASEWCRSRKGPALVHAHVVRRYSHSLSDDERLYKTQAERDGEVERDPVITFPRRLLEEGVLDRHALETLVHEVDREVQKAMEAALKAAPPHRGSALRHLYSLNVDPTSNVFFTEPVLEGQPRTMVDEINLTLAEEMRRDSRVLVFGEDVADCSREENHREVKGKGGVFSHPWSAIRVRRRARFQHAPRRSRHRRTGDRLGDARSETRGGDPVFRLHLAGDDADSQRTGDSSLAVQWGLLLSRGHSRRHRRLLERRSDLSQPVR